MRRPLGIAAIFAGLALLAPLALWLLGTEFPHLVTRHIVVGGLRSLLYLLFATAGLGVACLAAGARLAFRKAAP
jgi:hypothetical protein